MTKLTMNEELPFDERTTPPRVSTGDLPVPQEIRELVTDAYERYRGENSGTVADYIPVLAEASPDLFGIAVVGPRGWVVRDRGCRCAVLDPERVEAVRVRSGLRHPRLRGGSAAA